MAYATIQHVQARIPYREITEQSAPSISDVQAWLDYAEAYVNGALNAIELPVPCTKDSAVTILRELVVTYAEARVRKAYASAGGDGNNTDGQSELEFFERQIDNIRRSPAYFRDLLTDFANKPTQSTLHAASPYPAQFTMLEQF